MRPKWHAQLTITSGGGRGGGGGGRGGGGHMPPGAGRGGAPSGCNFKKNSKLSNKNKQILTRNERTGYPQSLPHSKFVAKNAIDSRKCVSFWGGAPDPRCGSLQRSPRPPSCCFVLALNY